jgi:hypothetical protein
VPPIVPAPPLYTIPFTTVTPARACINRLYRALAELPALMLEESGLSYSAIYWGKVRATSKQSSNRQWYPVIILPHGVETAARLSLAALHPLQSEFMSTAKAKTPLGRVPVLREEVGSSPEIKTIYQSSSIVRHLGDRLGLDSGRLCVICCQTLLRRHAM